MVSDAQLAPMTAQYRRMEVRGRGDPHNSNAGIHGGQARGPGRLLMNVAVCCWLAGGCSPGNSDPTVHSGNEIVVYSSVDDVYVRPVAAMFTRRTGVQVKLVLDTEETKSTGLLNRLLAESARPQADVFWSGDPVRAAVLQRRGLAEPFSPTEINGLDLRFSDPEHQFTSFSARLRVIIF